MTQIQMSSITAEQWWERYQQSISDRANLVPVRDARWEEYSFLRDTAGHSDPATCKASDAWEAARRDVEIAYCRTDVLYAHYIAARWDVPESIIFDLTG